MNIAAIIQARMGSSRLPGKAAIDVAGEPMLARVMARSARAASLNQVIVATTVEPGDDVLADLCSARGWPCFRGSQDDVLDRYYQAALHYSVDVLVRITSDCPLIDPGLIDQVVDKFLHAQPSPDYCSNVAPLRTYPRGLDIEVFHFRALERTWREAAEPMWREHVTLYMARHPELFRCEGVAGDADFSALRWTVDTPEDYELICRIYNHFRHDRFSWTEVLRLLELHPDWAQINCHVQQKAY
jgi:spore coat polysaccharide biosynthesis protein SpsF